MNELVQSFLEEANELLMDLEDSLLTLEETPNDKEAVHLVFRVMHTLKGSGGMFGFNAISDFTHHLESIYFKIRNEELKLSTEILTLTLKSVDLIKELLKESDELPANIKLTYDELISEISSISSGKSLKKKSKKVDLKIEKETKPIESASEINSFYIYFEPNTEILLNGTNPLYLIDELIALGEAKVILDQSAIPHINELVLENCYVTWEIILSTTADIRDILDVFIFVEDDCQIDIENLCPTNILQYPEIIEFIDDAENQNKPLDKIELKALCEKLHTEKPQEIKNSTDSVSINEDNIKPSSEPAFFNKEQIVKKQIEEEAEQIPEKIDSLKNLIEQPKAKVATPSFSTIRVSSQKIETLMNLVSEMVTSQARLNLIAEQIKNSELSDAVENLEKLTRQLRDNAFEISLIPIESLLTRFKRLIRDLSSELEKEVIFEAEGTDTELDKTIIENLSDPLLHIFRNAIDHGIEDSETRKLRGKPEVGSIKLRAFYSGTSVIIQIIDDGGGIDPEVIRKKAVQKGLIGANDVLSKTAILDLITQPGFSTAKTVTDVSGRGVGMDVVKKNIQKIQGELKIDSELGIGTTFTLKLPLTLSIIDGLIVNIADTSYIIPIPIINKIRPLKHKLVAEAFNNTMVIDNEQIPFIYLREHFEIKSEAPAMEQMIVVSYKGEQMGIIIDKVEKQSQVVVKSIGKQFHHHDIISGASIMGNGRVALVLDTNKIINSIEKAKK